jgi:hypothetical protein
MIGIALVGRRDWFLQVLVLQDVVVLGNLWPDCLLEITLLQDLWVVSCNH